MVKDVRSGKIAVFEAKYSKTLERLEQDCGEAIEQIDDRMYAKEFRMDMMKCCVMEY